jgi:hypothetical protein
MDTVLGKKVQISHLLAFSLLRKTSPFSQWKPTELTQALSL